VDWGMPLQVSHTTVNARDGHALSVFWAALLDYAEDPDDPNAAGHEECMMYSPGLRQRILFIEVEELGSWPHPLRPPSDRRLA
jgi:hypothetical protein